MIARSTCQRDGRNAGSNFYRHVYFRTTEIRATLTWTLLFHQVTGAQQVRVYRDGLLSDPELSACLLIGHRVDLHLLT